MRRTQREENIQGLRGTKKKTQSWKINSQCKRIESQKYQFGDVEKGCVSLAERRLQKQKKELYGSPRKKKRKCGRIEILLPCSQVGRDVLARNRVCWSELGRRKKTGGKNKRRSSIQTKWCAMASVGESNSAAFSLREFTLEYSAFQKDSIPPW